MEPRILKHYKVLSPGTYSPSPKEITITAQDVQDYVDAVNIKEKLGVPVSIKYMHRDGIQSIPIGKQVNAVLEGDSAYADLVLSMNAEFDGVVMATIEQMASGLQDQILQGSMEAYPGYSSPAYTGDRVFGVWPTAWAVLPAGEQPAVPPKLIAGELELSLIRITGAPTRGISLTERGQEMTLEEALKVIAELKAEIATLKKAKAEEVNTDLEAKAKTITELEAENKELKAEAEKVIETKAKELQTKVLDKVLAANRPKVEEKIKAMDSPAERVQFLEMLDVSLAPIEADKTKLNAGDDPGDGEATSAEKTIAAQKKAIIKAADDHKLEINTIQGNEQATSIAMRDNPELFKE